MRYDPDKHHRRSIRLKEYDYAQPGAYFVTVCTRDRECLFGHVVNGEMHLNDAGEIARRCWEDIPHHFPLVELDAFAVMPNHVHGIIVIQGRGEKSFAPTTTVENGRLNRSWIQDRCDEMVPGKQRRLFRLAARLLRTRDPE
jgi:putative transposase